MRQPVRRAFAEEKAPAGDKQLALLRRCINTILTRNLIEALPATYEGIFTACRSIVTIAHLGHDLYNILRRELELSISQISREMALSTEKDTTWIASFNKVFSWLEKQIVSSKPEVCILPDSHVSVGITAVSFDIFGSSICRARKGRTKCQVSIFIILTIIHPTVRSTGISLIA